jgi:hypothetical protein
MAVDFPTSSETNAPRSTAGIRAKVGTAVRSSIRPSELVPRMRSASMLGYRSAETSARPGLPAMSGIAATASVTPAKPRSRRNLTEVSSLLLIRYSTPAA